MRFLTGLAAVSLLIIPTPVVSTQAQERARTVEIFGGYSYLNFELLNEPSADRQNGHGVGVALGVNLYDRLALVGDFSFNAKDVSLPGFFGEKAEARNLYFLFGPRLSARSARTTAFGHALIGVAKFRSNIIPRADS
jgi:hypothetical protein